MYQRLKNTWEAQAPARQNLILKKLQDKVKRQLGQQPGDVLTTVEPVNNLNKDVLDNLLDSDDNIFSPRESKIADSSVWTLPDEYGSFHSLHIEPRKV